MELLSATTSQYAEDGWRLHSVQPVPIFFMREAQGTALLAVYEHD